MLSFRICIWALFAQVHATWVWESGDGEWETALLLEFSLCAVCVPHQVVFMASALRVLMKELELGLGLASVIQSVSMSGSSSRPRPPPAPAPARILFLSPFAAIETLFTQLVQLEMPCLLPKGKVAKKYKNILQSHQCK